LFLSQSEVEGYLFFMKLKKLLKAFPEIVVKGSKNIDIIDISSHSQIIGPGSLFVARRGAVFDGNSFVPQAIVSGAVCVLSDVYDPSLSVTQLITKDVRNIEPRLAAAFWQQPSGELHMVGVTGTSGKTTVTYLINHLFAHFGIHSGLIGSVTYLSGGREQEAVRTTPDACINQKLLRELVSHGATACVMEVSSHALDQGRVEGIDYDTAVFTNLTHEHLDYHKTFDQYAQAKGQLFSGLGKGSKKDCMAIINSNDPYAQKMVENCQAKIFTYGVERQADVEACDLKIRENCFTIRFQGQAAEVQWPLTGRFNVENALAAASVFLSRGYDLENVVAGLVSAKPPPGRLERVDNSKGLSIYVDYAHKVDALRNVLITLRELTLGKVLVVFGCGGERDEEKRPLMGQVAEKLADHVIVTSDNPRNEDPLAIIYDISSGFVNSKPEIIPDRREAIYRAISLADKDDIILIAGKGHERKQDFGKHIIDFDDRLVAREGCEIL